MKRPVSILPLHLDTPPYVLRAPHALIRSVNQWVQTRNQTPNLRVGSTLPFWGAVCHHQNHNQARKSKKLNKH